MEEETGDVVHLNRPHIIPCGIERIRGLPVSGDPEKVTCKKCLAVLEKE